MDSDEIVTMPKNTIETETEEIYARQPYGTHKHSAQHEIHHNLTRGEHCFKCGQARQEIESQEVGRRRKRRTKSQLQHCPSCHCPPETIKYVPAKVKYTDNVEAVLNRYENFLVEPVNSTIKKSQSSPLSPKPCPCGHNTNTYRHAKKTQSASRRQRRHEEEEMFSAMLKNMMNTGLINESDGCCGYVKNPAKSLCKKEGHWRDLQPESATLEISDVESDCPEKCLRDYQQYKKHVPKKGPRVLKQCAEKLSKSNANVKNETDEKEDDWWQQLDQDDPGWRFKFDVPEYEGKKKCDPQTEIVEENQDERTKWKKVVLPSKLSATRTSVTKASSSLQNSTMRSKNHDNVAKNKMIPSIDASENSKDEDLKKEHERTIYCKPRRRRSVLRRPIYRADEESTTNREETKEDSHFEVILKEKNPESAGIKRNIYAGGDLDLHATKSHILDLIDRALSNEFGTTSDQQKITESKQESSQQEICIEITRALQGDCCQSLAQDLLSHRGSSADYVKQLKILRWEHLNHIQEEFRKLCSLEKFLDACSPRQSLPTLHSNPIEQRQEEQEQQAEKQEIKTIS